jgi:hypothetical protein
MIAASRAEKTDDRTVTTSRIVILLALAGTISGCTPGEPRTTIRSLDWACGERRCTARFLLTNESDDDEHLLVLVRAYAGDDVASRESVGVHSERLFLKSRGAKRFNVTVDTKRPAQQVRVVLERTSG